MNGLDTKVSILKYCELVFDLFIYGSYTIGLFITSGLFLRKQLKLN